MLVYIEHLEKNLIQCRALGNMLTYKGWKRLCIHIT